MSYYGEGGIDKLIRTVFFPSKSYKGIFVEVGAADPTYLSISKHFRDNDWNTISIEPNPYFVNLHREAGNNILEFACGEKDEDNVEFELVHPKIAGTEGRVTYESFSAIQVKEEFKQLNPAFFSKMEIEKITVNMRRLDTLLQDIGISHIDILTVDVEGWELEVLSGLNFDLYAPKVMVVENWLKDDKYNKKIVGFGYDIVCRIFYNDIYVKKGTFSNLRVVMAKFYSKMIAVERRMTRLFVRTD